MAPDISVPQLESYFKNIQPPQNIKLGSGETIRDMARFLDSHFSVLTSNPPEVLRVPYYNRLLRLYAQLNNSSPMNK